MRQLQDNASRIEAIVVKLIDNSKKEREQNREHMKEILTKFENTLNVIGKLSGNGISHLFKKDKEKA